MILVTVAALVLVLATHLAEATMLARQQAALDGAAHREARLRAFSSAVVEYRRLYQGHPATATALAATPGFESSRGLLAPWQGYAVSSVIDDGTWRFVRAVAYSQAPGEAVSDAEYLAAANNRCGGGGFSTALSWCGPQSGSQWWRDDPRRDYPEAIAAQRAALFASLAKFAAAYSSDGEFPDPGAGSVSLTTAVGYGGDASTCSGTWLLGGIPLDCADLFDRWGNAVRYHYAGADTIHLTARAPIFDSAGNPIRVSAHLTLS